MTRIAALIVIVCLLSGCGALGTLGSNPLQGGACLGAQLNPATSTAPVSTSNITFSAPAGTSFALCSW